MTDGDEPGVQTDSVAPSGPADDERVGHDLDELRSELLRLQVELNDTRDALDRVAEAEAETQAENRRCWLALAEARRSPAWRLARRVKRHAQRRQPTAAAGESHPAAGQVSVPVVSLVPELAAGWPEHARWRPDARIAGVEVTALEQPVDTTVRYRLTLPAGTLIQGRVAISARSWREAGAGAEATVRLCDEHGREQSGRTMRLPVAVDGGTWDTEPYELHNDGAGDYVLELVTSAKPAELPTPRVLWVDPTVVLPQSCSPQLRSLAPRRAPPPGSADPVRRGILISVLTPVRDPEPEMLVELLDSVRDQTFGDWELCLVDDGSTDKRVHSVLEKAAGADPRVKLQRRGHGGGISAATNQALTMARGRYVAFLDHDDLLSPNALEVIAAAINADPDVDVLYSDEDHVTPAGQRFLPYRKPEWAPDSMRSQMYTGHLSVLRRELVVDLGGLRSEFDGSQDYDLILRLTEGTDRIAHLGQLLYHWRVTPRSAASGEWAKPYAYDAARRALQEQADRLGTRASIRHGASPGTYRTVYDVDPSLSIDVVLPVGSLVLAIASAQALLAALTAGGHERWKVLLTGPDEDTQRWMTTLISAGIAADRCQCVTSPSSIGAAHAAAARESQADQLLLLEGIATDGCDGWLRTLIGFAAQPGVGAVGAKVLASDGRIEHAGVVIGNGLPLPVYHGAAGDDPGHLTILKTTGNRSAVDGAVVVGRAALDAVGWIEDSLGQAAIVDYCLRACEQGLRVIWTPDAQLSLTGSTCTNHLAELAAFRARWSPRLTFDPFYSRAFWQDRADFVPPARLEP